MLPQSQPLSSLALVGDSGDPGWVPGAEAILGRLWFSNSSCSCLTVFQFKVWLGSGVLRTGLTLWACSFATVRRQDPGVSSGTATESKEYHISRERGPRDTSLPLLTPLPGTGRGGGGTQSTLTSDFNWSHSPFLALSLMFPELQRLEEMSIYFIHSFVHSFIHSFTHSFSDS